MLVSASRDFRGKRVVLEKLAGKCKCKNVQPFSPFNFSVGSELLPANANLQYGKSFSLFESRFLFANFTFQNRVGSPVVQRREVALCSAICFNAPDNGSFCFVRCLCVCMHFSRVLVQGFATRTCTLLCRESISRAGAFVVWFSGETRSVRLIRSNRGEECNFLLDYFD